MVGIFPNLNKENVRNALPAVVKAAEHAKIKVAFPLEIAEEFGVPGTTKKIRQVSAALILL